MSEYEDLYDAIAKVRSSLNDHQRTELRDLLELSSYEKLLTLLETLDWDVDYETYLKIHDARDDNDRAQSLREVLDDPKWRREP